MKQIRVILTGATGMVGEGVLHECLQDDHIKEVLVIGRKPCGVVHPKVQEIVHADFFDFSPIAAQLGGYDACFFCLGVSSIGMKEPEFYRMAYTLTMHVAETLAPRNPGMTFCYISGAGTDSTEKGRSMWARVKGKTENDLMKLPFKAVYNFRPGFLKPTPGLKNALSMYKYINWVYPFMRWIYPAGFSMLKELGLAMIEVGVNGYPKAILEVKDIVAAAKK